MTRPNIPQFQALTSDAELARIAATNPVIRRDVELLKARMQAKAASPSVVNYMRTVQADRRDAEIMRRYAFATHREQGKKT